MKPLANWRTEAYLQFSADVMKFQMASWKPLQVYTESKCVIRNRLSPPFLINVSCVQIEGYVNLNWLEKEKSANRYLQNIPERLCRRMMRLTYTKIDYKHKI